MKITYIHHSSFLVETEENYFLFDYFEGKLPQLKEDKPLLVFASHRHGDHFSPVIFELAGRSMVLNPQMKAWHFSLKQRESGSTMQVI